MEHAAQSLSSIALECSEQLRECITTMQDDREIQLESDVEVLDHRVTLDIEWGAFVKSVEPGLSNGDELLRLQQLAHEGKLSRIRHGLLGGVYARGGMNKPRLCVGQGKGLAGRQGIYGYGDTAHQPGLLGSIQDL
jgi:hypothetical protein